MTEHFPRITFLWATALVVTVLLLPDVSAYAADTSISATVKITVCGDGTVETPEQCDGSNLNGASCFSQGFTSGSLSCLPSCEFNTSQCVSDAPGGGGSWVVSTPSASAVFFGRAYPRSTVTLLKDGQIAATTIASADATFRISISSLSGGSYVFSFYSEDTKGTRSSLLTFPASITAGATTNVTGIFIAPTIALDKSEVRRGDSIAIFGQAPPVSEVTVSVNTKEGLLIKKVVDASGAYLFTLDTSALGPGQYQARPRAAFGGEATALGEAVGFTVGTENLVAKPPAAAAQGDFNGDGRVDLVDFSVAAYWYKRANPPASVDLNGDGRVDLVDFSVMAFHWTG